MKKTLLTLALTLSLTSLAQGEALTRFRVMDPMGRNTVQFRTSAPLEDIVGTTNQVQGQVEVNPDSLQKSPLSVRFEVNLASLQTGIRLRDTHMREHYLETDQYPKAIFTLNRLLQTSSSNLKPGLPVKLLAEGTFQLHGVTRRLVVPVEVTYLPASKATMSKLPGNLLRIQASFDVRLADYKIARPRMVILKVGEVAHVTLDAFATDAPQSAMAAWVEAMKKMMKKMMASGD